MGTKCGTHIRAGDDIDTTGESSITVARLQRATSLVYSDDARGTGSVDHDGWTAEAKRIGDLPTKESLQSTCEPMGQTQIDAHISSHHPPVL